MCTLNICGWDELSYYCSWNVPSIQAIATRVLVGTFLDLNISQSRRWYCHVTLDSRMIHMVQYPQARLYHPCITRKSSKTMRSSCPSVWHGNKNWELRRLPSDQLQVLIMACFASPKQWLKPMVCPKKYHKISQESPKKTIFDPELSPKNGILRWSTRPRISRWMRWSRSSWACRMGRSSPPVRSFERKRGGGPLQRLKCWKCAKNPWQSM